MTNGARSSQEKRRKVGNIARSQAGTATLLELSIVAIFLALAIGMYMNNVSNLKDGMRVQRARSMMLAVDHSLKAYALKNGRLPCPDLERNGWEARDSSGSCPAGLSTGVIPYTVLGMERPALGELELRYGVWRAGPGQDLVEPQNTTLPRRLTQTHLQYLRANAKAAADSGAVTGQPYVAGRSAEGEAVDCGQVLFQPAYVLSIISQGEATGAGSPCFKSYESAEKTYLAVGRAEFYGWVASQTR